VRSDPRAIVGPPIARGRSDGREKDHCYYYCCCYYYYYCYYYY